MATLGHCHKTERSIDISLVLLKGISSINDKVIKMLNKYTVYSIKIVIENAGEFKECLFQKLPIFGNVKFFSVNVGAIYTC